MNIFPNAFVSYLVEFHATRDYFECHELLEEYWKDHPGDTLAETWVGLIQLAVGQYHDRRGNMRGAMKMYEQAEQRLMVSPLEELGIDKESLLKQLTERTEALQANNGADYADFNIRIINDHLMMLCEHVCRERGLAWGMPSPLHDKSIIHRHTLRDRSDVIEARSAAFIAKKRERSGLS